MLCLTSCVSQKTINRHIPPCQEIDDLADNSTWVDLIEKYLEVRDLYEICRKKVEVHNGKLEN